jgi:iron(III) transport system ATP-binding protein
MIAAPFLKASGLCMAGRLLGVGFELARGSTIAILGPSGSGKTTLLRLLAGFEAPEKGYLELEGELVSSQGRILVPPERRHLAYAFQEPALMPHLDAIGNVHLGGRRAGPGKVAKAQRALADVGLPGFEHRRMWELSGGEAQRVQLARTLAAQARMLLLDEPFASVDRMCRADLLSRIGSRLRSGASEGLAAIVTHDPADAMELADVTMVLKAGRIAALGSFDRIAAGAFGTWPAQFLAAGLAGREIS